MELLQNTENNKSKIVELVGKVSGEEKQLKTIDESVEKLAEQTERALKKIEEIGNPYVKRQWCYSTIWKHTKMNLKWKSS